MVSDATNADAYIVFEADGMQPVPIGTVEQILPQAASVGRIRPRAGGGRRVEFITVGEGAEQASYRIVELAACH